MTGGFDGPHSACVTAADCTYGDYLDGGTGNDVIAGDNANILRTGSTVSPRFRVLSGDDIFDTDTRRRERHRDERLQPGGGTPPCAWVDPTGADPDRRCTVDNYGWQADPHGVYVRSIQLFDQTVDAQRQPAGRHLLRLRHRGRRRQRRALRPGRQRLDPGRRLGRSTTRGTSRSTSRRATRSTDPRQSVEDWAGPGSDGNDYVEGNAGSDVIYGDLGQDDLVGGSSDMFSLVSASQRSDASDTIYGGAGTRDGIDDQGDLGPTATHTTPT